MEIRSATICFSKERSKLTNTRDKERKRLLEELNTVICYSNNLQGIEKELKNYDNLKKELEEIYDHRGRAAMFPSKCRWVEQRGRPSKYFFNLERGNYNKKVISKLETENGNLIIDKIQILAEIGQYYQNLYSSEVSATSNQFCPFTQNIHIPRLTDDEPAQLEGPLTLEECHLSVTGNRQEKMDLQVHPNFTMNFLISWVQT